MTVHFTNVPAEQKVRRPVLSAPAKRLAIYRQGGKRALDLTLVIATCLFTAPIILTLALINFLSTGVSPFYAQQRVGRDGKAFRMWKLRTMLPNADELLEAYLTENPEARAEWDSKQKLIDDPRVTLFGRWLRKTSMDELPQLFNVLNGTMSLVGPRPMMLDQEEQYHGKAYFELRPGMTGPWQVSDRNNCDFIDRIGFDEDYNTTLSLQQDVDLLFKTVGVVRKGTGC